MKRIYLIIIASLVTILNLNAQISALGKYKIYNSFSGIDYIVMFNGIDNNSEIQYTGNGTSVNWYKYSDRTNSISNLAYITPEENTGYILDVDGTQISIWVFDYQQHLPVITSIEPSDVQDNECETLNLKITYTSVDLVYESMTGRKYTIDRTFNVEYETLEWSDTDKKWVTKDEKVEIILPISSLNIDAPLCDTYFTVSGDQFAKDLGVDLITVTSSLYQAVAVKCHITTTTTERTEKNEAERPDNTSIDGSAPLDILFESNCNISANTYYSWLIKKDGETLISRTDETHRYTFEDSGSFNVVLKVTNGNCSYSDSVTISVSTSAIQIPNVFTPNGDGLNDEFRVGYKSIVSFECWVYNRWGRKVYYWNDPQKGWDGTINGRKAAPGAYFYVIKAYGSDFDPNSERNKISKERTGEFLRKGDINLLRGAQ